MATELPLVLRFTPEELAALFEQMAAPATQLDYADLLPEYSEEERKLAIQVARRSLLARKIIMPDEAGGFQLHPLALTAVAGMMRQEPAVVVFRQASADELNLLEFHALSEGIYLSHAEPSPDVHELAVYPDVDSYRQAILDGLALTAEGELACPPGKVAQATLSRAIEAAENGHGKAAREALAKGGLPKETAEALAATLTQPHEFKTLVVLENQADPTGEGQTLAFLEGENGVWLLEGMGEADEGGEAALNPLALKAAQKKARDFLGLG